MGDLIHEVFVGEDVLESLGDDLGIEQWGRTRYIEMRAPDRSDADYIRLLE